MIKLAGLMVFLLLYVTQLYAQDTSQNKSSEYKDDRQEILAYKKLYKYADSLKQSGHPGSLDSDVYRIADSLDNLYPTEYFMEMTKLIRSNKLNEASFIYYLGCLRFRYYNTANPNFKESNEGALLASLEYGVGEPIQLFLRADFNNYIEILKISVDWYSKHDYKFFSKKINPEKYLLQSGGLTNTIADLEKNKEKFIAQWDEERGQYEKLFDEVDEKLKTKKTGKG